MALNQETLLKIQKELEGLSQEEQQIRLNEILATFPEEEVKELQKQQCIFCAIVKKEFNAKILYEDELVIAILDINPANPGHVLLYPIGHANNLSTLTERETNRLFLVANKITEKFQEKLNAPGFNILLNQGSIAGQKSSHILLHLIPRFKDDNLNFDWSSKNVPESETDSIMQLLKPIVIKEEEYQEPKEEIPEEETEEEYSYLFEPRVPS